MDVLVNIDVPDLARAEAFYTHAFGLRPGRRFREAALELTGGSVTLYLLVKEEGSAPTPQGAGVRSYSRHWSPVHLDFVVPDIGAATHKVVAAGAVLEAPVKVTRWGKIAMFADPFGHGFCLVEFLGRGYDEIADAETASADASNDDDLQERTQEQLLAEVRRLRAGIRSHRDASGQDLCWHHPRLWALLPEKVAPAIAVPAWPQFMRGCVRYRQSLDQQAPEAPRTTAEFEEGRR